jgi:xanthine/uracil permease
LLAAVWHNEVAPPTAVATVIATIGLGLLALGWATNAEAAERDAQRIWRDRLAA